MQVFFTVFKIYFSISEEFYPTVLPGIAGIPGIPPVLDVVEVEDDILEEENDEEDEKDPSSLFVEVAINCEAEEESCLTAVLPKISKKVYGKS